MIDRRAGGADCGSGSMRSRVNHQSPFIYNRSVGFGDVAQLGERRLCKPEVAGSIPVVSTDLREGEGRAGETIGIGAAAE